MLEVREEAAGTPVRHRLTTRSEQKAFGRHLQCSDLPELCSHGITLAPTLLPKLRTVIG